MNSIHLKDNAPIYPANIRAEDGYQRRALRTLPAKEFSFPSVVCDAVVLPGHIKYVRKGSD
jgi:hypothetical protein